MSESAETLSKLKLVELKALCSQKKLPVSGTKAVLIARLLGGVVAAPAKPAVSKKKKPGPANIGSKHLNAVLKNLKNTVDPILIKRNQFGHYEHLESGFVFSPDTKKVIGKQLPDGCIGALALEDEETLNHYHFERDDTTPLDTTVEVSASAHTDDQKDQEMKRLEELAQLSKNS